MPRGTVGLTCAADAAASGPGDLGDPNYFFFRCRRLRIVNPPLDKRPSRALRDFMRNQS